MSFSVIGRALKFKYVLNQRLKKWHEMCLVKRTLYTGRIRYITMTLTELSEKAHFIAGQQRTLRAHWNHYGNSLVQAITLSKASLYLSVGCNNDSGLGFWLFDHFLIRVTPEQAFNGHIFNYTIEARDNEESVLIGRARLSDDGMLDGTIAIDQREAVLDHFLEKINGVYAALYAATERGESLTLATLAQHHAAV